MAVRGAAGQRVRPSRGRLAVWPLAGSLFLASCGAATSPSPSVAPSSQPSVVASVEPSASPGGSAVQIELAPNWQEVELTEAALKAQLQIVIDSNPQQATAFRQLLDSGAWTGFEFYALGYDGLELIGNINVTRAALSGPLDAAVPAFEGQLRQIGATEIEIHHATLLGGDAVIANYRLPLKVGTSSVSFAGRISIIPVNGTAYVVTVTCYATDPSSCQSDGDAMVAGMTVGQ